MRVSMSVAGIFLLGSVVLLNGCTHVAELPGDATAGRALAMHSCSSCHLVDAELENKWVEGAPKFSVIANKRYATIARLRAFLQAPHGQMPDFILSREEIDDLITYILMLKRRPNGRSPTE